jgi:hypothetical protein
MARGRMESVYVKLSQESVGDELECAMLLNSPLQSYLNACFRADGDAQRARAVLATTPADAALSEMERAALRKARASNFAIISGREGERAVEGLLALLRDYDAGEWCHLAVPRAAKEHLSHALVLAVGEAWRRLVLAYRLPKYQLFAVGLLEEFSAKGVAAILRRAVPPEEGCEDCKDQLFAQMWLERLLAPSESRVRRAHACIAAMLAVLPVSSTAVERRHLHGQERAGPKRRGQSVLPATLARNTYLQSVEETHRQMRVVAEQQVLGPSALARWLKLLPGPSVTGVHVRK